MKSMGFINMFKTVIKAWIEGAMVGMILALIVSLPLIIYVLIQFF